MNTDHPHWPAAVMLFDESDSAALWTTPLARVRPAADMERMFVCEVRAHWQNTLPPLRDSIVRTWKQLNP